MAGRTKNQRRVILVLERMLASVKENKDDAIALQEKLNSVLTELGGEDFYGTEGATDPRGDMRDGFWSMWRVQGIDE